MRLFLLIPGTVLALAVFCQAGDADKSRQPFHVRTPLGSDNLRLMPANADVCILVTLDSEAMGSLWRVLENNKVYVQDAAGKRMKTYPARLSFRVTAGTKSRLQENAPHEVETDLDPQRFVSRLRFRLKIFHGLEARTVEATEVKNIGVPVSLPYDERIWKVTFPLDKVLVEDRLMLEVLDAEGNRLSKFHMELI